LRSCRRAEKAFPSSQKNRSAIDPELNGRKDRRRLANPGRLFDTHNVRRILARTIVCARLAPKRKIGECQSKLDPSYSFDALSKQYGMAQVSPENVEQLHRELADRIDAKDDEGVRRVYRELLRAGRSRLEVIDEVIQLVAGHDTGENAVDGANRTSSAALQDEIVSNTADNVAAQECARQVGGHLLPLRWAVLRPLLFAVATLPVVSVSGLILLHGTEQYRAAATAPPPSATASDASASGSIGTGFDAVAEAASIATSKGVLGAPISNAAVASAPPPDGDDLSTPQSGTALIVATPDLAIAREASLTISRVFGGVATGSTATVGTPKSSARQVNRPNRRNSNRRSSRERRRPAAENGSLGDNLPAGGVANTAGGVIGGATMSGTIAGGTVEIVGGTIGVLTDHSPYPPPPAPTCPQGYMLDSGGCFPAR
jgi:hypothetical protein